MSPEPAQSLESSLREILSPLPRLRLAPGKKVWDVRPRLSWNKGRALKRLSRSLPGRWNLMFVGDDATDEEGFQSLGEKAVTVRLGFTKISLAQHVLRDRRIIDSLLRSILDQSR